MLLLRVEISVNQDKFILLISTHQLKEEVDIIFWIVGLHEKL